VYQVGRDIGLAKAPDRQTVPAYGEATREGILHGMSALPGICV